MYTKTYIFLVCMFLLPLFGHAQSSLAFYHTDEMLYTSNFNPAFFFSKEKYTFSALPVAGGTLSLNDKDALTNVSDLLFSDDVNDLMKDIFKRMVNKKLYFQHGEMSLLNFGHHSKYGSFNFIIKDQLHLMLDFKGELSTFLMNENILSVPLNRSQTFPAEAIHFREYSLGYSNEVIERKLTVGFRAKLLYGKSFFSSEGSATTSADNGTYSVLSNGLINMSVPAQRVNDQAGNFQKLDPFANQSIMDYIFNTGNNGYAFDLGVKYSVTSDLKISASVANIGKINWKTNLHTLTLDGSYDFDINDIIVDQLAGVISKTDDEISFEDEISDIFEISDASEVDYKGSLPTSFYLGLHYKMNEQLNAGLVNRFTKFGELSYNSIAANINYKYNNRFTLVSGIGIYGDSYLNIPFGFLYKWQAGQAYFNIENTASILMPGISDFQGLSAGAVFYLFRPKMKYERFENLPFYKHKTKRKKDDKGLMFKGYEKK